MLFSDTSINVFTDNLKAPIPAKIKICTDGAVSVDLDQAAIKVANKLTIHAKLQSSHEILALFQVLSSLTLKQQMSTCLVLPYLPYARQDRPTCDTLFSLKMFADILNSYNLQKVMITAPHSDVGPGLINNSYVLYSEGWQNLDTSIYNSIISPDAGAYKRINLFNEVIDKPLPIIIASKKRCLVTNEITGTEIHGDVTGQTVLIVDDLCDGGRTFCKLAEALANAGAKQIDLYVDHGIFSYGVQDLHCYINNIYTHHNWLSDFKPAFPIIEKN